MSFLQVFILLLTGGLFCAGVRFYLAPLLSRKTGDLAPFFLSMCAVPLLGIILYCANYLANCVIGMPVEPYLVIITFLGMCAGVATLFDFKKPIFSWGIIGALCVAGVLLLPDNASLFTDPILGIFYCLFASILWLGVIFMFYALDRVPLFSFISFMCLFLGVCMFSSRIFPLLNDSFYMFASISLLALLSATYMLKKYHIYVLLKPLVVFFAYLIGFVGVYLAGMGYGAYLPVFVGYQLLEIGMALGATFLLTHKIYPLTAPFAIENAMAKNMNINKILQKTFFLCFILMCTAFITMKNGGRAYIFAYGLTAMLAYNLYLIFQKWGEKQPKLKEVYADLKMGMKELKTQVKTTITPQEPAPTPKKAPASTKRRQNRQHLKRL